MSEPTPVRGAVLDIAGERVRLLGERAAYWERTRTLLVADPHFGKAAAFRAAGVPVPRGTTTGSLARLEAALSRTGATRVVFLGDFLHAREGREAETTRVVSEWRRRNAAIEMLLVRGNHDKRAGDPGPEIDIRCVDGPVLEAPFVFTHKPAVSDDGYVICGHVHPGGAPNGAGTGDCATAVLLGSAAHAGAAGVRRVHRRGRDRSGAERSGLGRRGRGGARRVGGSFKGVSRGQSP